jgi:2,4-dienoyl-CoA reductase-like NADH-dependent reductase (Old Yellow Enzyme family)
VQKLFTEFKIKDLTLKNRIVMPPMCMYCAAEDASLQTGISFIYATRAVGGVGLIHSGSDGSISGRQIDFQTILDLE